MSFEKYKQQVKDVTRLAKKELVRQTANVLVRNSPVWTGEYVKGHIAEESPRAYPRTDKRRPMPYPPKIKDPLGLMENVETELATSAELIMDSKDSVSINNTASHASFVEYLGWTTERNVLPPHMTFAKTKESIELFKDILMDKVHRQIFKK